MAEGVVAENATRNTQQHFGQCCHDDCEYKMFHCGGINPPLPCHLGAISNGSSLLDFFFFFFFKTRPPNIISS